MSATTRSADRRAPALITSQTTDGQLAWPTAMPAPPARFKRAELATIAEAAWLLRIGRTKLYELLSAGTLPSYKVDSRRFVDRAALSQFVAALRKAS